VATASLATGVYETLNNFSAVPPEHPTVFEYFRKDLKRPSSDAWVVAPSNGFNRIGESDYRSYGPGMGAPSSCPSTCSLLPCPVANRLRHLLRDNYETPLYTPQIGGGEFELQQLGNDPQALRRRLHGPCAHGVESRRALHVHCEAPDAAGVAQSALDHHARYRHRALRRLLAVRRRHPPHRPPLRRAVEAVQSEPEYAGNTTLFILPDFRPRRDQDPGGNGFQHHRTGDAASRTTWMMALGAGVRQGVVYDRPCNRSTSYPAWAP
jgi:hypothetical protein